ncbi:unnamed protein product [Dracunculus medinensis]|uniref:PH domain-containing protein n=1 Tax=Dracunculus medinensis TaxID=318479 RepID=A0A0N4UMG3_DRAME|nr:unnamed protein product [Dracunculus medinensis]
MVFQSLYQPVENIASWTRFWCALDNGYLSFWRYPEDEMKKEPVVVIDLRSSACDEVKVIPIERCPYPNSMQIDVWIPSENPEMLDKIRQLKFNELLIVTFILENQIIFRILMAADKKDEMHKWLNAVNTSLRTLTLWNPKR